MGMFVQWFRTKIPLVEQQALNLKVGGFDALYTHHFSPVMQATVSLPDCKSGLFASSVGSTPRTGTICSCSLIKSTDHKIRLIAFREQAMSGQVRPGAPFRPSKSNR